MTSSILLKKQEEKNAKLLRDLLRLPENKKCFDCPTKSPFFVNTTLQTFICTRCSGLVREVGHRVKSISASKFSGPELVALELGGNGIAGRIWLSCGYNTTDTPEPESDGEVRAFMRQKYYEKKWLNRDLAVSNDQAIKQRINELFTEEGLPRQQARRRRATIENNTPGGITIQVKEGQRLNTIPKPLDLTSINKVPQPTIQTAPLIMTSHQPQPNLTPFKQPKDLSPLSPTTPLSIIPTTNRQPTTHSFFADLSELTPSRPTTTQSTPYVSRNMATPNGNTTLPIYSSTVTNKDNKTNNVNDDGLHIKPTTVSRKENTGPSVALPDQSIQSQHEDPYSALRTHHEEEERRHEQMLSAVRSITLSKSPVKVKTGDSSTDPYAALRQISFGPSIDSSVSRASTLPSTPQHSQPQHQHDSSLDNDKHHSTMIEEWVKTQPFVDVNDDEDLMTQISTTTSQSASSSESHQFSKLITKNPCTTSSGAAFSDLDPLAIYKRNKNLPTLRK